MSLHLELISAFMLEAVLAVALVVEQPVGLCLVFNDALGN
jgi:hypothetical protein